MSADLRIAVAARSPVPLAVDLHVASGELVAVVGPSGSGKSTLLRTIAGLHTAVRGRIHCGDTPWLDSNRGIRRPPQERRVGMVFQDYALFPHLTARDNLVLSMDHGNRRERRERAAALLAQVRLQGLEDRFPAQLSGGQQQRVAVARALAREPRVLLLDEPFAAVDMMTRERLQRELALLRQGIDIPTVLVTHDLQEAAALADRLCVVHEGRSLQTGPPEALFRQPASAHVARLLGNANVFRGVIERDSGGCAWLRWGNTTLEPGADPGLPAGARVDWAIPEADILLHRRGRPSRGERENPVSGTVSECVVLGTQTSITLDCPEVPARLRLALPTHAARRNGLATGVAARVSLLAQGIHIMPADLDSEAEPPQEAT